jgi:hypothetical protein
MSSTTFDRHAVARPRTRARVALPRSSDWLRRWWRGLPEADKGILTAFAMFSAGLGVLMTVLLVRSG